MKKEFNDSISDAYNLYIAQCNQQHSKTVNEKELDEALLIVKDIHTEFEKTICRLEDMKRVIEQKSNSLSEATFDNKLANINNVVYGYLDEIKTAIAQLEYNKEATDKVKMYIQEVLKELNCAKKPW